MSVKKLLTWFIENIEFILVLIVYIFTYIIEYIL